METGAFFIEFLYKDKSELAEVKPCCQKDNAFYYDVYIRNQYQFTVTPFANEQQEMSWKVSLKNADKNAEPKLVEIVGQEIEKHLF